MPCVCIILQILMDRVAKGRVTTIPFVLKVEIWPFVSALNVLRNMSLCVVATESPTITNVSSSGKPVSRKQTLPSSKTHLAVSQFRLLKFKRVSKWAPKAPTCLPFGYEKWVKMGFAGCGHLRRGHPPKITNVNSSWKPVPITQDIRIVEKRTLQ